MPIELAVVGADGRMGTEVLRALRPPFALRAAFVRSSNSALGRSVREVGLGPHEVPLAAVTEAAERLRGCAAVVSFAAPAADLAVLPVAADLGIPSVVGTTGYTAEDRARLRAVAERAAVVFAPNFSAGIGVLPDVFEGLRPLSEDFDASIVEAHHAGKKDAPSGTALSIAEALGTALGSTRAAGNGRPPRSIPVQSVRAGGIPGEHTIVLAGAHEELQVIHRVHSRRAFVDGALRSVGWLLEGRAPGLYSFRDVLGVGEAAT